MVQSGAMPSVAGLNATCDDSLIARLVAAEGSAVHGYVMGPEMRSNRFATRNLADAIHYLAALHARYPGVIDLAAGRTANPCAGEWLMAAVDGFAVERALLTRLVVAAGPQPSTPGQAECESAVIGQRHALEMLAQSDRQGCAIGAAIALMLDWHGVRPLLDKAADRMGVVPIACKLPSVDACNQLVNEIAASVALERAIGFGAQQLIGQHRGLWDLLEARAIARGEW